LGVRKVFFSKEKKYSKWEEMERPRWKRENETET
jgi:hypothetical protein